MNEEFKRASEPYFISNTVDTIYHFSQVLSYWISVFNFE